ncbi:MAG: nuclear transport factor 2 family protein [Pseudomonadales bacterium]|nr:MAG: nuclear transport factor 2 family protein [Pseudomonadales bacterium]
MADRVALQHLVNAYCHAIDRRNYALLRTLYHPGASDDHRPYFQGSAEDYINWLPSMLDNWQATSHAISNCLFIVDGDEAEGEILTRAWHRSKDGKQDVIGYGRYADRYQKRDGIWRFAHRSLVLDYADTHAVNLAEGSAEVADNAGQAGSGDPVYTALALFAKDRTARNDTSGKKVK